MTITKSLQMAAAALLIALPGPAAAQQYLNFRDADIRAFIEDAARVTGRNMIIDPDVEGRVSVITEQPLSRSAYFQVFLETLRANGLVALPLANGGLRISSAAGASRQANVGSDGRFLTQVVPLRRLSAEEALGAVSGLISPQGQVSAAGSGNALVIADYSDNISRIRGILSQIDRDTTNMQLVPLNNSGAREIARAVTELTQGPNGQSSIAVVPVDSSNSVILRGDPTRVAEVTAIVKELDSRAALGADVRVYYLEYADAEALLPVLQQIAGQTTSVAVVNSSPNDDRPAGGDSVTLPAGGASVSLPTGGERARAVIARYAGANAVIISAPPDLQKSLGEVIIQLDQRQDQVQVEVIVAEVSDSAARALGVQFLLAGLDGTVPFASTNYSNQVLNPLALAGAIGSYELENQTVTVDNGTVITSGSVGVSDELQRAAAQSLLGVTGGLFGVGGRTGDTIFGAILNAVKSDTASNILAVQTLLTLNNQDARYLVGQEVPITTGEALSSNFDNTFRTVERQKVGIELNVRPQINAGGSVKLFLAQEVSSVAGPVTSGSSDLILNARELETTITVDDGDIVALGGLLNDEQRQTIEKIPLLGDIPLLGELFTSRSRSKSQTNLMVFIRPRIVRSREDAQALAAQRYGYVRDAQQARDPDSEPALDRVLREYLATVPPTAVPTTPGAGFMVEVASFADADKARAFAERVDRFGLPVISARAGVQVVGFGPFATAPEAERVRRGLLDAGYRDTRVIQMRPAVTE